MRRIGAAVALVTALTGGALWYSRRSSEPVPVLISNSAPASSAMLSENAVATAAPTLATLPPQRIVLRIVTYGVPVILKGVDSTGTQTTLADIYKPANLEIIPDPQPARPYPSHFGAGYLTMAELNSLATEPQSAGNGWKVAAFLLRRGTKKGDLGMIFPDEQRDHIAVFTEEIGPDPNKVLRTLAHELGHTLNLFHNDGDADFSCCSYAFKPRNGTSLMNQNACLDPHAWTFQLNSQERDHLLNHAIASVDPNGKIHFGECTATHRKKC